MLDRYVLVLRSYLRPAVLGLVLVAAFNALIETRVTLRSPAFLTSASQAMQPGRLIGAAMFAGICLVVLTAAVALHAKDQVVGPRGALLPHFRPVHAAVALALSAAVAIGQSAGLVAVGASPFGALAYTTTVVAASLWLSLAPVLAILLIPAIPLTLIFRTASIALTRDILSAEVPLVDGLLLLSALVGGYTWARRLLRLKEESWGCGMGAADREESSTQGHRSAGSFRADRVLDLPARSSPGREPSPPAPGRSVTRYDPGPRFARLDGYVGEDTWQRVRLWRLGMGMVPAWSYATWAWIVPVLICVLPHPTAERDIARLSGLTLYVFGAIFVCLKDRLGNACSPGYASLRPSSKPRMFRELGMALALDALEVWVASTVLAMILGALWIHSWCSRTGLIVLSLSPIGLFVQLGLLAWLTSRWPKSAKVLGLVCFFLLATWPTDVLSFWPEFFRSVASCSIAALVMTLIGLVLAHLAHRAWCRRELG